MSDVSFRLPDATSRPVRTTQFALVRKTPQLSLLLGWGVAALLVMPLVALLWQAVFVGTLGAESELFAHLSQTVLSSYVVNSLGLVCGVIALSLVLGVSTAWLLSAANLPGRSVLRWAMVLPLALPPYIVAYLYTDLLDAAGPVQIWLRNTFGFSGSLFEFRSLWGAILVLGLVLYPYVYLLTRSALREQSASWQAAARMLGCTPRQAIFRVTLPLARPAMVLGAALVAMETLADFGTVNYFAVPTLTTAVYDAWLGHGDLTAAAKLSVLLLMGVAALLLLESQLRARQRQFQRPESSVQSWQLSRRGRWWGLLWCLSLLCLGFVLPVVILLDYAIRYFDLSWRPELWQFSYNSLSLSVITAGVCVALALGLTLLHRRKNKLSSKLPLQLSSTGYAIPGTVLAIGVLIPFGTLDLALNNFTEHWLDWVPGLIFSGTAFAVLFAWVVRFLPLAMSSLSTGLGRIAPSLDAASQMLGQSGSAMLCRVHVPLLLRSILVGGLLVFLEAMKELPAALLLRPFNFETLATWVYQFVSDEQLERGALAAVLLVLVGLLPVIWLERERTAKPEQANSVQSNNSKREMESL